MQCRTQHGSSVELDVFRATRYFAAHAHCATDATDQPNDRLNQGKVVLHDQRMPESFRGHVEQLRVHDLSHDQELLLPAKPAGKSLLASFLGFMVSPSPGASFRKNLPPPTSRLTAAGGEPAKFSSSTTSSLESTDDLIASGASVQSQGCGYGLDLGVATGDRRLQGVRVVRGSWGDDEKWVVKCTSSWFQEEQREGLFGAASSDKVQEGGEDGNSPGNWESDSSSDLFDLDIECIDNLE
ncbi:hypothetical protein EJB05_56490, partial [Eragrostis curvula]